MAATLTPYPRFIVNDSTGNPIIGAAIYTYAAGTTTPQPTFTDQSGNTPNPNPTVTEAPDGGANIWLNGAYKIDIKSSVGGTSLPGFPIDNVTGYAQLNWTGLTATIAQLNACDTSTLTRTTTYSVALSDRGKTILCDASSGSFTISLPSAATALNGYEITFKKVDATYQPNPADPPTLTAHIITLDGNGAETIEGQTTYLLYDKDDVITLLCDGSNWRIKSGVIRGVLFYQSAAFTVSAADLNKTFMCTASANYAVTLPSAATVGNGFRVNFKKTADVFNVTLTPAGAETIDGQANYVLTSPYQVVGIMSDGTNWYLESNTHTSVYQTGDVQYSWAITAKPGWVAWDDGSIGNGSSGGTTRANADCADLFALFWDNIANTWCPVSDSSGNPVARGASASADFTANRRIQLPRGRGKALGISGSGSNVLTFTADSTTDQLTFASNKLFKTGTVFQVSNNGGALPTGLSAATNYYAIYVSDTVIQIASSLANAQAGTPINFTTNGTGTQFATITLTTRALGEQVGEEAHSQTTAELAGHAHDLPPQTSTPGPGVGALSGGGTGDATGTTGSNTPFNIMQPTVFGNAFIKL